MLDSFNSLWEWQKGELLLHSPMGRQVSIPYGNGKRLLATRCFSWSPVLVSIPYGNGKRITKEIAYSGASFNSLWEWQKLTELFREYCVWCGFNSLWEWQKGFEVTITVKDLRVSIPYGNGKRKRFVLESHREEFQFPMGMAKGRLFCDCY